MQGYPSWIKPNACLTKFYFEADFGIQKLYNIIRLPKLWPIYKSHGRDRRDRSIAPWRETAHFGRKRKFEVLKNPSTNERKQSLIDVCVPSAFPISGGLRASSSPFPLAGIEREILDRHIKAITAPQRGLIASLRRERHVTRLEIVGFSTSR